MHRILAATMVLLAGTASSAVAADFYAGKQISLVVGAPAGGGYDLLGRVVSRHIGKLIPGAPGIIVQNMPAANSIAATNHLANVAARDQQAGLAVEIAEPVELCDVELHACGIDELRQQHAALDKRDGRTVARGDIGQMIGGGDAVGGGHILHDDPGGAGNELADMP